MRTTNRRTPSAFNPTLHRPPSPAQATDAPTVAAGAGATVAAGERTPGRAAAAGLRHASAIAVCAAAIAWMLVLYRPWESAPFSILDFSAFLPLLKGHATFGERLSALVTHYAAEGRLNLLPYVALALKWSVFGDSPVAWQWIRACQMFAIFAAAVAVLRGLGVRWTATACGASLFVTALPVASAWTRLTMGEPLAVPFVLAGALCALRYQRTTRWRRCAAAIVVSLVCALLSKEMLVLTVPFLLLTAWLYRGDGEWSPVPERSRRNVVLLLWVAAAVAAVGVGVLLTLLRSHAGSFGSAYGSTRAWALPVLRALVTFALPFSNNPAAGPENVFYAAVVGAGVFASWKTRRLRPSAWLTAASLPAAAALLYLPWPDLQPFYALSSLLGSALLLALAVDALGETGRVARALAVVVCVAMFLSSSRFAYSTARIALARRGVDAQVARLLASAPADYTAVLAIRPEVISRAPERQWMMRGPTLSRYAAAVSGHRVPLVVELTCDEVTQLIRVSRPIVVTYDGGCSFNPEPTVSIRAPFDYWSGADRQRDALTADILWPFALPGASSAR